MVFSRLKRDKKTAPRAFQSGKIFLRRVSTILFLFFSLEEEVRGDRRSSAIFTLMAELKILPPTLTSRKKKLVTLLGSDRENVCVSHMHFICVINTEQVSRSRLDLIGSSF